MLDGVPGKIVPSQFCFCVTQNKEDGGKGGTVKLSTVNGLEETDEEEGVREMITPALGEALTKQGWKHPFSSV